MKTSLRRSLRLQREPSEDKVQMARGDSLDKLAAADSSTLKALAAHYRDTASIHGVSQVGGKPIYSFRRWLWALMMVAMLSGLISLLYLHFQRYALYPTVTVVNAHMTASVPFPAVTICNLNQYHHSRIPNDPNLRKLLYRLSDFAYIKDSVIREVVSYGTTVETVRVETGEQLWDFAMNAAHTLSGMFRYCVWQTRNRPCGELFNVTVTDLGVCYTFNADRNSPRLHSTDSGPLSGLRIILDIQQDFYYFSMHSQSGIKVLLHEPDEAPLLINRGFYVRPGTCTDVVIRRETKIGLPKPYKAFGDGYCLDTRSSDFRSPLTRFQNFTYTESACWRDCYTRRLVEKCGCRFFFDPGDDKLCSVEALETCYIPNAEEITMEDIRSCDCRAPCSEAGFTTSLSFTDFASKFIIQHMFNSNLVTNTDYVRENLIELRVYYDSLMVTEVVQQPEMTVSGILGNVGGHMGLFLGASILSVTEVVEVVVLAVVSCCMGRWGASRTASQTPTSPKDQRTSGKDQADSAF